MFVSDSKSGEKGEKNYWWKMRKSLTVHYLTDLLLVKTELLVKILCIFWFIVSFYIMYASTYGWIKMNI